MEKEIKSIAIDFDGVINSYISGWKGADNIPDPPIEGVLKFIDDIIKTDRYKVEIFSTRNHQSNAINAMKKWLIKYFTIYYGNEGKAIETVSSILFPINKPKAHIYIDDRAFPFKGKFPSIDYIDNFEPWSIK